MKYDEKATEDLYVIIFRSFFRYPDRILDDSCLWLVARSSQKQRQFQIKKKGAGIVQSTISTPIQMVPGEIFIEYANEAFPFLLGRKGTFDREGVYLSVI